MTHRIQQQQILMSTDLKLKMTHQKKERNQNIDMGKSQKQKNCVQPQIQTNWRKS